MKIIGFDPGLRVTGWGVIEINGSSVKYCGDGSVASSGTDMASRLLSLYQGLTEIVREFRPDVAAVEKTFVSKDAVGSLKLGQARAIAILVPAIAGLEVTEYSPNSVKKAVVGVGHADKQQVAFMIRMQLPKARMESVDSTDALAVALTHAFLGSAPYIGHSGSRMGI